MPGCRRMCFTLKSIPARKEIPRQVCGCVHGRTSSKEPDVGFIPTCGHVLPSPRDCFMRVMKSYADLFMSHLAHAVLKFLKSSLPMLGSSIVDAEAIWTNGLTLTYAAELRPERATRARQLVQLNLDDYALLNRVMPQPALARMLENWRMELPMPGQMQRSAGAFPVALAVAPLAGENSDPCFDLQRQHSRFKTASIMLRGRSSVIPVFALK